KKTYNTRDSLVVTDPTTSLALTGLSMGERTGSRIFQWVWSYVLEIGTNRDHVAEVLGSYVLPRYPTARHPDYVFDLEDKTKFSHVNTHPFSAE
ncbi:hypothetical protein B0T26DRAFT_636871, partial [Lasiosphaeria miniovina]